MAAGTTGLLFQALKDALFLRASTIGHDTLYWFFPVYHFFADNLLQGRFPYWNPFSHAGEPFYPLLLQLRMLEPVTFLSLALGSSFTSDLVTLFNWDRVARGLFGSLGAYLFLRQWATHWVTRISLIPVLLWSSFSLAALRQTATIDEFISAPYVAYFLFRILYFKDSRWVNWLGLGISIGVAWQSYYFAGVWILLLYVLVGFLIFRRDALHDVFQTPHVTRRIVVVSMIVGLMAAPNAVVWFERGGYVFPARMIDHSYRGLAPLGGPLQYEPGPSQHLDTSTAIPYLLVRYTGTFSTTWDFLQLIVPDANPFARGRNLPGQFGEPSESFMYVGLLVYAGALLGIIAGRHEHKRIWLVVLAGFGFLLLGPIGGLYWLLYQVYPPLWFVRHTHTFVSFFLLALLYFYVLGANRITEWQGGQLFEDVSERGPLGRVFSPRWLSPIVAFGVFLVIAFPLGLQIFKIPAQSSLQLPVILLLLGVVLWVLRRNLGGPGLFWGLVLTHILLVLKFSPHQAAFLTNLGLFLGLPLGALLLVRFLFPASSPFLPWALALFLAMDLYGYLHSSFHLWTWPRPDRVGTIAAKPSPPKFPETRRAVAFTAPLLSQYEQSVRYVELASRTPMAFSSLMHMDAASMQAELRYGNDPAPPDSFLEKVVRGPRWNSFVMPRSYFDLIHSGIPAKTLGELLAIGHPLIQFRPWAVMMSPEAFFSALRKQNPTDRSTLDLNSTVALHENAALRFARPPLSVESNERPMFRFTISRYDYDSIELSTESSVPGFLYYADGYDPHWRAFVDRRPVPVLRANENFKAVPIDPGTHVVQFVYNPVAFRVSLYLFFMPLILSAAAVCVTTIGRPIYRAFRGSA